MAELDAHLYWLDYWLKEKHMHLVCDVCGNPVTLDYNDKFDCIIQPHECMRKMPADQPREEDA